MSLSSSQPGFSADVEALRGRVAQMESAAWAKDARLVALSDELTAQAGQIAKLTARHDGLRSQDAVARDLHARCLGLPEICTHGA